MTADRARPRNLLPLLLVLAVPARAATQETDSTAARGAERGVAADAADERTGPLVDTIVVRRQDIFSEAAAGRSLLLRLMNGLHVTTRPRVVRRETLLEKGRPWSSKLADETERNLRRRGIFRSVSVDSQRLEGGRLAVVVNTVDAWSILPQLEAQVASDGTLTGSVGATETNLLGTGNSLQAWYVRDVDRDGLVLGAGVPRVGRGRLGFGATYQDLSDRRAGSWAGGTAFRSLSDRWSVFTNGHAFDGRVLSFRSGSAAPPDTVRWQRRALVQRVDLAYAPVAGPRGYLRVGLSGEARREEFFPRRLALADSARFVPDTAYGLVGAWAEARRADFRAVRYLNGFTEEDQDVSGLAFLGLKLAPGAWGYGETGIGIRGILAVGAGLRPAAAGALLLLKLRAEANGLLGGARPDSGRVLVRGTAALKAGARHASFLSLSGTLQDDPPPGGEVDLGFRVPPRLWHPHAFTGTRSFALTLEHRWYAWDGPSDVFGLGVSGFLDYGGAWFADQDPRAGGNVGGALLVGWPLRATPLLTEARLGWRFGGGIGESDRRRLAASLGMGLLF